MTLRKEDKKTMKNMGNRQMIKKMKIVFLIDSPRKIGGGDYAQFNFARKLSERGHEVVIFAKDENFFTKDLDPTKNLKIFYYRSIPPLVRKVGIGRINNLWRDLYTKIRIIPFIKDFSPDWIIGYLRDSAIRAADIGKALDIKVANFIFETPPWMEEDIPKEWEAELQDNRFRKSWEMTKEAYKDSTILIPNSKLSRKMCRSWIKDANITEPVYPGVDGKIISNYKDLEKGLGVGANRTKGRGRREYDIIYVGRLNKLKNVDEIILASAEVKPKPKVLILGGGEEHSRLKALADKKEVDAEFKGAVSDEEKWASLRDSKLLVFPSSHEGFGMPPLEALASGCQAICSDKKIFREIYGDSVHYFRLHDIEELSKKISRVLKGKEKISPRLIGRVIRRYSWESSIDRLEMILQTDPSQDPGMKR